MTYRLKSRAKFPPQSWKYRQRQTGWEVPNGLNFDQAVAAIVQHRLKNALQTKAGVAVDANLVAQELDAYTCQRLGFNPHWVAAFPDDKKKEVIQTPSSGPLVPVQSPEPIQEPIPPPPNHPPTQSITDSTQEKPRTRNVPLVEKIRRSASGVKTLTEWFGDGGVPVEQEHAEKRSVVCIKCPMNMESEGFDAFTKAAASAIKRHIKVKDKAGLKVPNEQDLGTCEACGCATLLKIWVPVEHIEENSPADELNALHPDCWIRKELKE